MPEDLCIRPCAKRLRPKRRCIAHGLMQRVSGITLRDAHRFLAPYLSGEKVHQIKLAVVATGYLFRARLWARSVLVLSGEVARVSLTDVDGSARPAAPGSAVSSKVRWAASLGSHLFVGS